MARPEYADERSHKFFSSGFVGSSHGDNGTSYSTHWDSTSVGLHPTAVHTSRISIEVCAYCGNRALPIQTDLGYRGGRGDRYISKGHTCCCSGAMDEREYVAVREAMLERHHNEIQEMEKAAPVPPKEVLLKYATRCTEKALKSISDHWGDRDINNIGLVVGKPPTGDS